MMKQKWLRRNQYNYELKPEYDFKVNYSWRRSLKGVQNQSLRPRPAFITKEIPGFYLKKVAERWQQKDGKGAAGSSSSSQEVSLRFIKYLVKQFATNFDAPSNL